MTASGAKTKTGLCEAFIGPDMAAKPADLSVAPPRALNSGGLVRPRLSSHQAHSGQVGEQVEVPGAKVNAVFGGGRQRHLGSVQHFY